jgi:hypothetical protein
MNWTSFRREQADCIRQIVEDLEDFHPLTLRQVHYQAVARGLRENTRSAYNDLSKLVKQMRLDGHLPWDAIEDRSRHVGDKRGWTDAGEYLGRVVDAVSRYQRCLIQGQDAHIEVWCEKDALRHLFEQVTWPLCIRLVITRGFSSVSLLKDYSERVIQAHEAGQFPVLLFFSDFDPSGMGMLESIEAGLRDIGLPSPILPGMTRPALTLEQIEEYSLPNDPDALKPTDTRAAAFIKRYGRYSVELDALHPQTLQEIIRGAIEKHIDTDFVEQQREVEALERAKLEAIRADIEKVLHGHGIRL